MRPLVFLYYYFILFYILQKKERKVESYIVVVCLLKNSKCNRYKLSKNPWIGCRVTGVSSALARHHLISSIGDSTIEKISSRWSFFWLTLLELRVSWILNFCPNLNYYNEFGASLLRFILRMELLNPLYSIYCWMNDDLFVFH